MACVESVQVIAVVVVLVDAKIGQQASCRVCFGVLIAVWKLGAGAARDHQICGRVFIKRLAISQ
jgi:hypothetical protein